MTPMRATVTEMPDEPASFRTAWKRLADHVRKTGSDLVLLPEMPAHPWFCTLETVDEEMFQAAVEAHRDMVERLPALGAPLVLGSRPVKQADRRVNEAFAWSEDQGAVAVHEKHYLPDEPGWREARWFHRGERGFDVVRAGDARVGFLVCTDVMFNEHARRYGREDAHLVAVPRASETAPRWDAALRMAAVASGAYVLSSNRSGPGHLDEGITWGGEGMVVNPEGEVLARTSGEEPFRTVELDLAVAEQAKASYPRYVEE